MPVSVLEIFELAVLGMLAGTAGGLVGLGGSVVVIPVLTLFLGRDQHVAQATAMIVNVFIAVPSALRHAVAGTVPHRVVAFMLPVALASVVLGVEVSNRLDGHVLRFIFGLFLLYVGIMKMLRIYHHGGRPVVRDTRVGWLPSSGAGAGMGFTAGLLGIGGGPIAVPLLQRLCRLPMRPAIAASAAAMCVTSPVGALHKNLTLSGLGFSAQDSVVTALCIAPTAALGGLYGAGLTHRLPLLWVRVAFAVVIGVTSLMMLKVW